MVHCDISGHRGCCSTPGVVSGVAMVPQGVAGVAAVPYAGVVSGVSCVYSALQ